MEEICKKGFFKYMLFQSRPFWVNFGLGTINKQDIYVMWNILDELEILFMVTYWTHETMD